MSVSKIAHGWAYTNLGEVLISVVGGGTPARNTPSYFTGQIPWFTVKDMKSLRPSDAEEHISLAAIEESATNLIPANTLIVATRIALGRAIKPSVQCAINQDLKALFVGSGIDSNFLLYWVLANDRVIQDEGSGTTVSGIRLETLRSLPIDLPPAAEQTCIVEKLEELLSDLDTGVAELKAAQRKLAQYRQSLLKAAVEGALTADWRAVRHESEKPPRSSSRRKPGSSAFRSDATDARSKSLDSRLRGNDEQKQSTSSHETGADLLQHILTERRTRWETRQLAKFAEQGKTPPKDWKAKYPEPVAPDTTDLPTLPRGWVWVTVDHLLVDGPQNGLYLPASRYGRGSPILRIDDFQSDWIRPTDMLKLVETDEETFLIYALHEGDLVVNRVNSITHLGKSHIVRREHDGVLFESNMMRASLSGLIDATFVGLYLSSEIGRARLIKDAKWAVNQASINQQDVKRTPVPLPGFSEQLEICAQVVAQLQEMVSLQSTTDISLNQSAAQRKNIFKAAFAGQLVPQDPNDEPASALLERIRAERAADGTMNGKRGRKTTRKVTKEAR